MANSTTDAETRFDDRRRQAILESLVDNQWSWIGLVVAVMLAGWTSQFSGGMAGTNGFYVGLFLAFAVLALLKGAYGMRRRLKQVEYAAN